MVPASAALNPAMILRTVVLPEPLGPRSVAYARFGISKSTPRSTSFSPKRFTMPSMEIAASTGLYSIYDRFRRSRCNQRLLRQPFVEATRDVARVFSPVTCAPRHDAAQIFRVDGELLARRQE